MASFFHDRALVGLCRWMNEAFKLCFYYVLLYTQSALQSWGGLSSTTTSVQHPLGWCDGSHSKTAPVRSPHTSYRWRGERVIETIKWMGIIRRPWLTRASGGNLARTPDGTADCVYQQWFLEVFLGLFSNVNDRIMPMSDAVSSEGQKTTGIQQRSSALSHTHRDFSSFSESFDDLFLSFAIWPF